VSPLWKWSEELRYRQNEAAERIGISARSLRRWENLGWITRKRGEGQRRYSDALIADARVLKWAKSGAGQAFMRESGRRARQLQKLREQHNRS